jgi:hypothetical protein
MVGVSCTDICTVALPAIFRSAVSFDPQFVHAVASDVTGAPQDGHSSGCVIPGMFATAAR